MHKNFCRSLLTLLFNLHPQPKALETVPNQVVLHHQIVNGILKKYQLMQYIA